MKIFALGAAVFKSGLNHMNLICALPRMQHFYTKDVRELGVDTGLEALDKGIVKTVEHDGMYYFYLV